LNTRWEVSESLVKKRDKEGGKTVGKKEGEKEEVERRRGGPTNCLCD